MLVFVLVSLLCALSSFAITLTRKRELVALLLFLHICLVTVNVLRLFLTVPWVGLQCMIVVFPDHTHLLSVETVHMLGMLTKAFTSHLCYNGSVI